MSLDCDIHTLLICVTMAARWTRVLWPESDPVSRPAGIEPDRSITVQLGGKRQHRLNFADETFDRVACPLGLSLLQGARPALAEWRRLTKPGGSVASSAFGAGALQPLADLYADQLFEYGLTPGAGAAILPWRRFAGPEAVSRLVRDAGFADVEVVAEQLGFYLSDADAWWDILLRSGLLLPLEALAEAERSAFKAEHLHEVAMFAVAGGVWLDLPVVSVVARV